MASDLLVVKHKVEIIRTVTAAQYTHQHADKGQRNRSKYTREHASRGDNTAHHTTGHQTQYQQQQQQQQQQPKKQQIVIASVPCVSLRVQTCSFVRAAGQRSAAGHRPPPPRPSDFSSKRPSVERERTYIRKEQGKERKKIDQMEHNKLLTNIDE